MFLLLCGIGYCSVASALFVVISVATFGVVVADVASIVGLDVVKSAVAETFAAVAITSLN
jgi:hypothetical protein